MPTVEIPDHGIAEFPDSMTPDEIKGVIQNKFYSTPTPSAIPVAQTNERPVEMPSGIEAATAYGQEQGAPSVSEQLKSFESLPESVRTPLNAAAETVAGFVPKTPLEVAGFATPVVGAVQEIAATPRKLYDVLFGEKSVAEAFPESQLLAEAEKTPPFSKERYKAGFEVAGQLGMGALIGRSMMPKPRGLSETIFGKETSPEIAAVNESLTDLESKYGTQPTIGEPNASQITIPTSVTQPEVRTPVGEETPLRQQGETPEARQGIEAQPQEVAPVSSVETPPTVTEPEATRQATTVEQPISKPEIPTDAKATVKFKTDTGDYVSREMNAREAEGIFTKERSSYKALIDCLGR